MGATALYRVLFLSFPIQWTVAIDTGIQLRSQHNRSGTGDAARTECCPIACTAVDRCVSTDGGTRVGRLRHGSTLVR